MTTKISEANIQDATLETLLSSGGGGPKISSVVVTDSSYVNLDDTAVALEGGFVKLIGSGFAAGCQVLVGLTPATSVTYISETEVRAQLPATAAGTYIIYLVNSDGGTAIRVNAVTFSGTPTWVSSSALAGGVDTAISIQLTATDATTFALAAGSTLPPGITLSSGGLLSGTITGISQETVYNFVINAVDAELQDSPRSFAFTVTAGDQFFNSTTLLLPGNATTFVRDASANNFPVTVFGDTRPNTFNPYLTGWSNFFDGSGDFLTLPSNQTQFTMGTGDFTIEMWVYVTSLAAGRTLYDTMNAGDSTGTGRFAIQLTTGGSVQIFTGAGSTLTSGGTVTVGSWNHIAYSRNSSSGRLYLNGVQVNSTHTDNNNYVVGTANRPIIGVNAFDNSTNPMFGYISNLRVVKGTALYTANFTPPTTPLTAVVGTSLLTCQSNRFADNSTNNFAITRAGDVAVRSFSPFVEPATTNGSGFFDGTGDYLTLPFSATTALWFDADYTIEMWLYNTVNAQSSTNGLPLQIGYGTPTSDATFWAFGTSASGNLYFYYYNGAGVTNAISTAVVPLNSWNHVAMVYTNSNTTLKGYINGVQVFSVARSGTPQAASSGYTLNVGVTQNVGYRGYISNLRIVKGTAIYTAAFTPPTAPLTAVANTSLLTLQNNQPTNNSMFLDSSTENFVITRSGNTTQGSFSPYSPSGWSNFFDGTGDFLEIPANSAFDFGSDNFTIECWAYISGNSTANTVGTREAILFSNDDDISGAVVNGSVCLLISGNASTTGTGILFYRRQTSGAYAEEFLYTGSIVQNTWHNIAVTKSGSTVRIFLNGTQVLSQTATNTTFGTSSKVNTIADRRVNNFRNDLNGYISNLRVVKGTAVYTTNFIPSTTPLTAISGTSLLTCADNRFVDDSANNFAITRTGDVRVTNFSPFKAQTQTPTTYSGFFDGTGDYLSAPATDILNFGTGDFTVEFWLFSTNITNTAIPLSNDGPSRNVGNITFFISSNGSGFGIQRITTTGGAAETIDYSSAGSVLANVWNHFAATKVGTTIRLFLNGVLVTTATSASLSWGTQIDPVQIGRRAITGFEAFVTGYISNLRVVKGTAVYTANFTPPTTPLTAIANTSLLTCQSATFADNSTNRFPITAVGNSQPTQFNPFGSSFVNSTGYTAVEHGGSMYFDGTGDLLTVPANAALGFGTGDFTIETWYYTTVTPTTTNVCLYNNGTGNFFLQLRSTAFGIGVTESAENNAFSFNFVANQWYHIAVARSGSTVRGFVNGILAGTGSNTINYGQAGAIIGGLTSSSQLVTGYLSNLRVVKGTALYTSSFAPPIAPVEPTPNTVLLLNGTAAAIGDATTRNVLETVGDARISSVVSKWGGSSMAFDGTGDALSFINRTNRTIYFGSGNWTVETWVYHNTTGNYDHTLVGGTVFFDVIFGVFNFGAQLGFWNNNTFYGMYASSNLTAGVWRHIAYVRNGNVITLYINGTSVATQAFSGAMKEDGANDFLTSVVGSGLNGYMQDVRITKAARYTATFAPPATAFQTR